MLALGAASAQALARSRTMLALVLNRSDGSVLVLGTMCMPTISCHAGLSWHTGGNEDDIGTGQALSQARWSWVVALDGAVGVDVGDICGDTGAETDIVQSQVGDTWVQLHQQGERLANTTGSTEDGDLGVLSIV